MDAIKNIFSNEHLLIGVLLIIGATVLCALGVMPRAEWESYSQIIFGIAGGTHAIISAADSFASAKNSQTNAISDVASGIAHALAAKGEGPGPTAAPAPKAPTEKV